MGCKKALVCSIVVQYEQSIVVGDYPMLRGTGVVWPNTVDSKPQKRRITGSYPTGRLDKTQTVILLL